jgi:glyoxalase family protein
VAPRIESLHHVTATVDDAQADLDFYGRTLGLRLVKQTVNFDNPGVYHFYYGDRTGTPGSIMTTFPYRGMGVPVGRKGSGQITGVAFSVPAGAIEPWAERFSGLGVAIAGRGVRFGESCLEVADPSGLRIQLVGSADDRREAWHTEALGPGLAVRGIHSLELSIASPEETVGFLSEFLGLIMVGQEEGRTRLSAGGGGPGSLLDILATPNEPPGVNGLGTVHHLALAVRDPEIQLAWREEIRRRGIPVTEVLDRQYFRSIYFREPGGVLLEIATVTPGFLVDEDVAELGQRLKLPPWEEPHRARIERSLPPVALPGVES